MPVTEAAASGEVTFRVQRLEPRLLWALAAFSVWTTVVLYPSEPEAWLLAVLAAAVGGWARTVPARKYPGMFARAALLLAGALVFQVNADAGGPDGPVFAWPVLVVLTYSMLLPRRWAMGFWALAAIEFVTARLAGTWSGGWQLQLAQAAVSVAIAYVGAAYAQTAHQLDDQAEAVRRDRNSRLYNEAGFFAHGAELFDACRNRKRPFSLVLLNSADLRDVSQLAGKRMANQVFAQLVQGIAAATPPDGLAARTDAVEFGMVLPGVNAVRAAALVHERLGNPPKVHVKVKDTEVTVILDVVVAEATPDVPMLEDMYDRLRAKLAARAGEQLSTVPSELQSTLQGMLEPDRPVPRHDRPTMPMAIGALPAARDR